MEENKLSMSGLTSNSSMVKKLGRLTEIEAIVTGTLTRIGDEVKVHCKVIDTGTAKQIAAASRDIKMTDTIKSLMTNLKDASPKKPSNEDVVSAPLTPNVEKQHSSNPSYENEKNKSGFLDQTLGGKQYINKRGYIRVKYWCPSKGDKASLQRIFYFEKIKVPNNHPSWKYIEWMKKQKVSCDGEENYLAYDWEGLNDMSEAPEIQSN